MRETDPSLFPARMPIELRFPDDGPVLEGVIAEVRGRKLFFYTNCQMKQGDVVFVVSIPPELTMEPTINIAGSGRILDIETISARNFYVEMEIDEAAPLTRAASHYPFANVRTPRTR
ncbi:hypothetical protein [Pseudacidobacterium ailaaui]|jgi:hypothetical protein|uniref:hypothetical protein n=1 Tax=Pseudacidobacterium ailaaui TaxID=1382359 RepID=UPI0012DE6BDE|nr:hypothetical protein [Pseudacidobacterium ailaaui]MBX6361903.1 hypothetical protein [Pseudacidobacterium ailaaui]